MVLKQQEDTCLDLAILVGVVQGDPPDDVVHASADREPVHKQHAGSPQAQVLHEGRVVQGVRQHAPCKQIGSFVCTATW